MFDGVQLLLTQIGVRASSFEFTATNNGNNQPSGNLFDRLEQLTDRYNVEVQPMNGSYNDIPDMIPAIAPAVIYVLMENSEEVTEGYLIVTSSSKRRLRVLTPQRKVRSLPTEKFTRYLQSMIERPYQDTINQLLAFAELSPEQMDRSRRALFAEHLGQLRQEAMLAVRIAPSTSVWRQLLQANLLSYLLRILVALAVSQLLFIVSWLLVGSRSLSGNFDTPTLIAWALITLSSIPVQLFMRWLLAQLSIRLNMVLRNTLLFGTLKLDAELIQKDGIGQILYRVMELNLFDQLLLTTVFTGVVAFGQFISAAFLFANGLEPALFVGLFFLWVLFAAVFAIILARANTGMIDIYRLMTNDIVERMVGHRTRIVQEEPQQWHEEEDQILSEYIHQVHRVSRVQEIALSFIGRGWTLIGLAGLFIVLFQGNASVDQIALTVGGIFLVQLALSGIITSIISWTRIWIARQQLIPLFQAARKQSLSSHPDAFIANNGANSERETILYGQNLSFAYPGRQRNALEDCSFRIYRGDRIILEGPSGGGKSSLASVLAGLYPDYQGLLFLNGYDLVTVGEKLWRKRATLVPQFHANHVLSETLAFNLLMGRTWPPEDGDLEEAEAICRELGLGELLDKLPGGLFQQVGESGWQLSHGERSRLYIARALLQNSELIILDESFGSLDPETRYLALECVLRRAKTLIVIAHP